MISKNKPKICFVGNANSVHLQRWIDYFKREGEYEVYAVSSHACSREDSFYFKDLVPKILKFLLIIPKVRTYTILYYLKKLLRNLEPDIVHIHQLGDFGALFGMTNYHPMVISTWGSDIVDDDPNSKLGKRKRKILLQADLITATSVFLAKKTEEFINKRKKVKVISFGIDVNIFDSCKVEHEGINIGFYKHLKEKYGPKYLIEAINLIKNRHENIHVFMAGEGEQREELEKLAKDIAVDHLIEFTGWLPPGKLIRYYKITDIAVMPSVLESETFGVAALEASAMKIPVIASNVGGVPEVIKDGETGILVEPKNVSDLAKAITKLIENKDLRSRMGKAGREFVKENYKWEKNAKKMETVYRHLLNYES